MSIQRFKPEIWSANLLVALRKALVYGGPMVVNHDYEGEIAEAGDTVRITSISRPTIGNYVPNSTTITPEQIQDAQRTLVVDQSKYFAFSVDDVDARQAKGNVLPQAADEAAYALADVIDQYLASLYTGVPTANTVGTSGAPIGLTGGTSRFVYNQVLVPLRTRLTKANVPTQGRYAIIDSDSYGQLLQDDRFVKVNESGTSDALRNGFVGRAAGFDIYESNNTPNPTGTVRVVQAGTNAAISMAEQINKTEAYRPQSAFSDAIKGLALYGAKLLRPDNLAIAFVDPAAAGV
jgi:N4-gp56 family major capsid protein